MPWLRRNLWILIQRPLCVFVDGFSAFGLWSCQFSNYSLVPLSSSSTESSEEGFPHTQTSRQPSLDGSDRASQTRYSSHPLDYLFLSQCETGRYVQTVQPLTQEAYNTFNKHNVFLSPVSVDVTAFQTLRFLWSRSQQTMLSRTSFPRLFSTIPLHPASLRLYRQLLPLHYVTAPQVSSSLTSLIRLRCLRQQVKGKRLLLCHLSPSTCQSSRVDTISQTTLHYFQEGRPCHAWTISK